DQQQLPGQTVRDAVVHRGLRLQMKSKLEAAGVRVPPGLEMQARVAVKPLRLARASPVADAFHAGREGRHDLRGKRPEESRGANEAPLAMRGRATHRGTCRHGG